MSSLETMKDTLIVNEIEYIKSMVEEDRYEDLVEYVHTNYFGGFKSMSQEEIKELYDWRFNNEVG